MCYSREDGYVDTPRVVEKGTHKFLQGGGLCWRKWSASVDWWCLLSDSILWRDVGSRGVGTGDEGGGEALKHFGDVPWHGESDGVKFSVKGNREA